uniref:Uncharacterized protein n=1 Tax=Romanomermis culicivorax TaxID=13658 RepID=A0A915KWR4_ROMCU
MQDDDLVSEATCLTDEKFEAVLKVLAESGSKSTSSNKVTSKEDHLVYKLKQKADAERQLEDELFSDGDYSSIEFDSKKLKKCTSHESYKKFSGIKSSNFSSVHVDAAVKFPFFNKTISRLSKNERSSHSENDTPSEQNLPSYCENEEHSTIVDETVTDSNLNTTLLSDKSSEYDLVPQGYEEKRFSKLQDVLKNHYDEIEMVDSIDLRKKATYTTNTTDSNGCHDKRRSNSQKDNRSKYCDNLLCEMSFYLIIFFLSSTTV